MVISSSDITSTAASIWEAMLGLTVHEVPWSEEIRGDLVIGCVHVTGDWNAAVQLECTRGVAELLASIMFGLNEGAPTADEVRDAVGELTNMIGGGIKALAPGSCFLSLPAVVEGEHYRLAIPRSRSVARVALACEGRLLRVHVVAAEGGDLT